MPAEKRARERAEETVGDSGSTSYQRAQEIVLGVASLKDAVTVSKFLDPMSAKDKREVGAVLKALPPDVDLAFMASLREALDNNANIAFSWSKHPEGGFDHSVATRSDGTVVLMLRTPPGDTLT
jgi:hypothetical protein